MSDGIPRHRKPPLPSADAVAEGFSGKKADEDEPLPRIISFIDLLRVLSGLLLLSCVFSWLITDGSSLTWGYRPRISRWRTLKSIFVPPPLHTLGALLVARLTESQQPTVNLTELELSAYTGVDPTLPLYVAVNGSVFDVSANPGMYGPGGGYHFFAGRDAARAFVSGCFDTDLTHDLRGLEEMYITGTSRVEDDAEAEEIRTLTEEGKMETQGRIRWLNNRREKRRREAWKKVEKQIDHWDNFFRFHDKYFYVGKVMHESLEGMPVRELCGKQGKGKRGGKAPAGARWRE